MKEATNKVIRIIVVLILNTSISTGIRVLASILQGVHGKPSFVTPEFSAYSLMVQLLLLGAYIILGNQIPVKNKIGKGLLFILLYWASDYMAQILGMFGAPSAVIQEEAMSLKTILLDSIGYLFGGILMGVLLTFKEQTPKRECNRKRFFMSAFVSMITFPTVLFALEMIIGKINAEYMCYAAFGVDAGDIIPFYIVFYGFQAFSGFLFSVFYRFTEFNSTHDRRWLRFASVYGCMLWSPIVIIVAFFGVALPVTLVYAGIMLLSIYIDTFIFVRIMEGKEYGSKSNSI